MNCPPSKPELNWLGYGRERPVLVEGCLYGLITQESTLKTGTEVGKKYSLYVNILYAEGLAFHCLSGRLAVIKLALGSGRCRWRVWHWELASAAAQEAWPRAHLLLAALVAVAHSNSNTPGPRCRMASILKQYVDAIFAADFERGI